MRQQTGKSERDYEIEIERKREKEGAYQSPATKPLSMSAAAFFPCPCPRAIRFNRVDFLKSSVRTVVSTCLYNK